MHTILSFNSFQQVAIFISFMPLCPQYAHWIILKQVILAVYLKVSQGIFLKYEHSFTCNTTQISLLHLKKKFLKIIICSGHSVFKFTIVSYIFCLNQNPRKVHTLKFAIILPQVSLYMFPPTPSFFSPSLFYFHCQLFAEETGYLSKS